MNVTTRDKTGNLSETEVNKKSSCQLVTNETLENQKDESDRIDAMLLDKKYIQNEKGKKTELIEKKPGHYKTVQSISENLLKVLSGENEPKQGETLKKSLVRISGNQIH